MLSTQEIVFRVRVVRDASCVRSCAREICLRRSTVFRIRVLLLLLLRLLHLRSVAPLMSRWCHFRLFFHFFVFFHVFFDFVIFLSCHFLHLSSFFMKIMVPSFFSAAMRFRVAALASGLTLPPYQPFG